VSKYNLSDIEAVNSIFPFHEKYIFIDSTNGYLLLEVSGDKISKKDIEVVKKGNGRAFVLDSEKQLLRLFILDEKDNVEIFNKKL
jgi:hypothetical protein